MHVTAQLRHRGLVTLRPRPGRGRILDTKLTVSLDDHQRRKLIELRITAPKRLDTALRTNTELDK